MLYVIDNEQARTIWSFAPGWRTGRISKAIDAKLIQTGCASTFVTVVANSEYGHREPGILLIGVPLERG